MAQNPDIPPLSTTFLPNNHLGASDTPEHRNFVIDYLATDVRFLHPAHIGACLFIFVFLSLLLAHNPNIRYYNISRHVQPLLSTNKSYIFTFCPLSH